MSNKNAHQLGLSWSLGSKSGVKFSPHYNDDWKYLHLVNYVDESELHHRGYPYFSITAPEGFNLDTFITKNQSCSIMGQQGRMIPHDDGVTATNPHFWVIAHKGKIIRLEEDQHYIIGSVIRNDKVLYAVRYSDIVNSKEELVFYTAGLKISSPKVEVYRLTLYTNPQGRYGAFHASYNTLFFSPNGEKATWRYHDPNKETFVSIYEHFDFIIEWTEENEVSNVSLERTPFELPPDVKTNTSEGENIKFDSMIGDYSFLMDKDPDGWVLLDDFEVLDSSSSNSGTATITSSNEHGYVRVNTFPTYYWEIGNHWLENFTYSGTLTQSRSTRQTLSFSPIVILTCTTTINWTADYNVNTWCEEVTSSGNNYVEGLEDNDPPHIDATATTSFTCDVSQSFSFNGPVNSVTLTSTESYSYNSSTPPSFSEHTASYHKQIPYYISLDTNNVIRVLFIEQTSTGNSGSGTDIITGSFLGSTSFSQQTCNNYTMSLFWVGGSAVANHESGSDAPIPPNLGDSFFGQLRGYKGTPRFVFPGRFESCTLNFNSTSSSSITMNGTQLIAKDYDITNNLLELHVTIAYSKLGSGSGSGSNTWHFGPEQNNVRPLIKESDTNESVHNSESVQITLPEFNYTFNSSSTYDDDYSTHSLIISGNTVEHTSTSNPITTYSLKSVKFYYIDLRTKILLVNETTATTQYDAIDTLKLIKNGVVLYSMKIRDTYLVGYSNYFSGWYTTKNNKTLLNFIKDLGSTFYAANKIIKKTDKPMDNVFAFALSLRKPEYPYDYGVYQRLLVHNNVVVDQLHNLLVPPKNLGDKPPESTINVTYQSFGVI